MSTEMATPNAQRYATAGDYLQLMKPRIMMLVVFTAAAGLVAAQSVSGLTMHPFMAVLSLLAIAIGSGAAGAINMWYDRDIDAVMARTATRPIPSGAVPGDEALTLGLIMSGVSIILMWTASNALSAILLGASIAYYGWLYTMVLKRATPQNIVIGGGAGAFPPVIGWAAVTGNMPLDAWILFAIIFFWTPPHFWALSLLAHGEYEKAGVPMLPVTNGAVSTRRHILAYTLLMVPIGLAPAATGLGGWVYLVIASGLSLKFLHGAVKVARSRAGDQDQTADDIKAAKHLFLFSILYLFLLFAALIAEHGFGLYWQVWSA